MGTVSFELSLLFYFIATAIGILEIFRSTRLTSRLMFFFTGLGFFAHTVNIIYRYAQGGHIPIATPHEATSFFAWCTVLIFFVMELRYRVGLLGSFIMPIALLLMVSSSMLPREIKPLPPVLQSGWFGIHILFAFLGNAAFALACGMGIMYLLQERYVKSKHLGDLFRRLPSLQTLDELNYRLITWGFPLLTLAIITGALWANTAWGGYWRWDIREVGSLVTWLIYAIILHARLLMGWRGRRAAVLSIIGFATILIAFFGIKILKQGMHVFL